jgi:phosphatidylglycerol:prolipoprotein diacylglycerol transferase
MVPYVDIPSIPLWGSVSLEPFGLLVLTACIVAYVIGRRHAERIGLDGRCFNSLVLWVLIPAFLFSHWLAVIFYFPDHLPVLFQQPYLLSPMSSYGGFLGGALGAMAFFWWRKVPRKWDYIDALTVGSVAGWFFARLGCTVAHDHPGLRSDFVLAVQFPDGARHDLGFYEWLFTIVLCGIVFSIRSRSLPPGTIIGVVCVCYAPARFLLDFLRIDDARYIGLTPAQYGSVALLVFGCWILARYRAPHGSPSVRAPT